MIGVGWRGRGGSAVGVGVGPICGESGVGGGVGGSSSECGVRLLWSGQFACGARDAYIECVAALA